MEEMDRVVRAGESFEVPLRSTPTSGFRWEVSDLPEGIEVIGTDIEPDSESPSPGDAVGQIFRLRTEHPGEFRVTFTLRRSWEDRVLETHTVIVRAT